MLYRALTQAAALGGNPSSARRTAVSAGAGLEKQANNAGGAPGSCRCGRAGTLSFNNNIPLAKRQFLGMINAVVFRFRGGGPADDGKQH